MEEKRPLQLDNRIYLIDGFDLGVADRTGSYIITEEKLTIVETGPSPSIKHVKKGLEALGYQLTDVAYIVLTHIHLDHAGGAGLLIRDCPNAKVVVHPKGKRHLINPKKLAAGARAVYGESFSDLFDPIVPIEEERLLVKSEGDVLEIGQNCVLEFWDTPGHAKHHLAIFDPVSNGLFVGDTAGIRYQQLANREVDFFLPSTSPNQFEPNKMEESIQRMQAKKLDRLYFGHYSMTEKAEFALQQVLEWLEVFMEEGEQVIAEGKGYDELAERLLERVQRTLRLKGVPDDHEVYILINLDLQVSALGIMDYFKKLKQ
ncbi:MBL fold metallo-hydrolase [Oceanobacillus manasiensis]|uniref:MBL fold metallo-hydrolase n=1 Tax=Oceanobacillus manasiensis TaxID=586413 RepID=UPI0005A8CD15|nr:MBL fold metallo-hydrolase [Oceanobacillus manasiensis]